LYNYAMINRRYFVKKFLFEKTEIYMFTFGPLETNCYLLIDDGESAVIDPSIFYEKEKEYFIHFINDRTKQLKYIIDTHGHFDHISGNNTLKNIFPHAKILIHESDSSRLASPQKNRSAEFGFIVSSKTADVLLKEGKQIIIGNASLKVLHTPGHTEGSIALYGKGFVFTGDTIFAGNVGTAKEFKNAFSIMMNSIKEKILTLPENTVILPGHMEYSTVGEEKQYNPFIYKN
jgi:hydroxyacylglutathione hydrolase